MLKRSYRAIYNRVMESIVPKVKRMVLNELSQDTIFRASRKANILGRDKQAEDFDQYGEEFQDRFNNQINAIAAEKLSNVPVRLSIDRVNSVILADKQSENINEPAHDFFDEFQSRGGIWNIPYNSGELTKQVLSNAKACPSHEYGFIEGSIFEFNANIQFSPIDVENWGWDPYDWIVVNFQDAQSPKHIFSLLNIITNKMKCNGWWIYAYYGGAFDYRNAFINVKLSIDDPVAKKTFTTLRNKICRSYKSRKFYSNSYVWGLNLSDKDKQKYYPDGVLKSYGILKY